MQANTNPAPLSSGTEDLIISTVQTAGTRPHAIVITDMYSEGDRQGGRCVQCGDQGELSALRYPAPHAYGCMPGIEPFVSPPASWL